MTDGRPICPDCSSELIPSDRHGWLCPECSPDSILEKDGGE